MIKSSTHVLVVEDDESIAMGLEMNLQAEGYKVDVAHDGETGLAKARSVSYDLMILDVMMPRLNGFELLRTLRSEGRSVPVIMLSAKGAEMEKVMGLELGAEDYITKPFGLAELLARVRAVLRRAGPVRAPGDVVRLGAIAINRDTREVQRGDTLVSLTKAEFDILMSLVDAAGRVLSREEIQDRVWGPHHHGTLRTIDNFVLQLRQKLEEQPTNPKHILTVRGVGYRVVG